MKNIVLFAGGVGGAKAAKGLYQSDYKNNLTIIGNVGDDDEFHNLWVSPDLDTLTYTLANEVNPVTGWGLKNDSCRILSRLAQFGSSTWMHLGDMDIATHIFRSAKRAEGTSMTAITRQITTRLGITVPLLPATDDNLQTRLKTENGWVDFQTYFVHQRCEADVTDIAYKGAEFASATPEVLAAIEAADIIVFAPSNPLLSIAPMLAIPQIRDALAASEATKIAVSPLIAGKAIKGPAEKLLQQMSYTPGNKGIAEFYQSLCDVLVIDNQDDGDIDTIESFGLHAHCTSTLMKSDQDKVTLMEEVISAATAYQLEVPCA
ncbi:2-phospho-L-lactate transferase [Alteromonas sp. 38]|uniref:2-phospho-L-lactate transferase n=1 Tax=Alteromonas TaxID=226 RepID=UPI0012F2BFDD|nr:MULTISPECIES: 2-phospho-L-lactate transferase [Alteromonas]CAD5255863.1 2-phospho-L-lactate transferase [Alteromonas sp. 154]VXA96599.1 2-phospho-L-lactate transferase [Alteromonas sp. 38]